MTVSWGMCHCVFYGRSTIILDEHAAFLFRVCINLSKEERGPSIGNNIGIGAVSEAIERSRTGICGGENIEGRKTVVKCK